MDIEQDAPSTDSDVAAAPIPEAAAIAPPATAPARVLTDQERTGLAQAALAALENNLSFGLTDGANRAWFVGTDNVSNQTTILIRVSRGEREQHVNISTAVFNDAAVANALSTLDAALAA